MAKAPSLAAESGALSVPNIPLPDIFKAPQEKLVGKSWPPYIAFAHSKKTDELKKIMGVTKTPPTEHDTFFINNDIVIPMPTFKVSLLCCKQYWVLNDTQGKAVKTFETEMPKPYKEHIEAVVLVYVEDTVVPANIQFRSTKCPAGLTLSKALEKAGTPAWADESPAHKETLALQQPWWRFFGVCQVGAPRNPRGGGNPYRPCQAVISPTGPTEWRALQKFNSDPKAAEKAFNLVGETYAARLAEVAKLKS